MTEQLALPQDYSYSQEHEWVSAPAANLVGATVRVGITAHAANELGEIVFVDAPAVGDEVTAGEASGEVESTKSVSDLYSPVTGEVTAVNEALVDNPGLLNSDPYGEGWLFEVLVSQAGPVMDAASYARYEQS